MMIKRFVYKFLRKILPKWIVIRLRKVRDLSKLDIVDRRNYLVMMFKILFDVKENKTKPNIKSNIKSSIDELVSLFSKKEYNRVIEIYEFKSD